MTADVYRTSRYEKNSPVAVRVTHLTDGHSSRVVEISAGGDLPANGHNMALLSDGTVMAWGDNADGQLGNGNFAKRTVHRVRDDLRRGQRQSGGA